MSRYGQPIHKFITKRNPPLRLRPRPDSIFWRPKEVKYGPIRQGGLRWEIFAQRTITIQPKTTITLDLGFGVKMTKGKCLVLLNNKIMGLEIIKDETISEDVEDIIITIENNSDTAVTIKERDSLCYIMYIN